MGLALHNSSNALESLSQGPSQVTTRPRPRAHYRGAFLRADGSLSLNREYADQRLHLLDLVLHANHQNRVQRRRRTCRRPQNNRTVSQWRSDETAEGRAIAALSGVRVPGEAPQLRRTPSLERQGAFRLPGTTKGQMDQEQRDVAELYRLGLLYDDEYLRGEGFELGSIVHDEPEFAMRPAKRARRTRSQRRSYEDDLQLTLDISLAELGRDESFARYLLSPDLDEPPSDDESTLERLHPATGLITPPESLCGETPDLTSESDFDSQSSLSSFTNYDQCTTNHPRDWSDGSNQDVFDDAWMVLGDGS
ncbi:hypothetical protein CkaCkLH20_09580 [Colletotrichum karsti]|uniref:Uncharacterized protein n=1 Tax=Colletotrichum karsti TaxID=1095194 RepID=A0A9P6I6V8_9PEZI|nr:uncharacterized protein CkaCkLH20_09580 [Colletotrichum karsti]KAF9873070.1 hypothetical protein CkaCkLH20_09580 [Colletotrichum karsti]